MTGDLSLFKRAMIEATCEIYDEQCSSLPLPPVSRRHKRRLAAMGVPVSALPIKYRLVAALVAALLLLTGCTLFHEEIRGLWLRFYDGCVQVSGEQDNKDAPKIIETLYAPTYLPEGFVEVPHERVQLNTFFSMEWRPADASAYIEYSQRTQRNDGLLIDTDRTLRAKLQHGDITILKFENNNYQCYVWSHYGYVFNISTETPMSDETALAIIDSLEILENPQ